MKSVKQFKREFKRRRKEKIIRRNRFILLGLLLGLIFTYFVYIGYCQSKSLENYMRKPTFQELLDSPDLQEQWLEYQNR